MEVWKEFEENEITHSAAHYLMAIRELSEEWGYARVSDIAQKLNITKGSASQSLKALKQRGLVIEDEHRLLHLSEDGRDLADRIAGRAQVLKQFFHEVLGVEELQAEIDACKIEHLISPEASERLVMLVRFLSSSGLACDEFRKEFALFRKSCPGLDKCPICENRCLVRLEEAGNKGRREASATRP